MIKHLAGITIFAAFAAATAQADLNVRFDEGAPKDRFTVTNAGGCDLPSGRITIDLGTAPAGLIFDVTAAGAGVEVFQPFEVVAGGKNLRSLPTVNDGQSAIVLDMDGLAAGSSVAFTIDVDDTGGGREITVTGSEISGATVRADIGDAEEIGTFGSNARATVPIAPCRS